MHHEEDELTLAGGSRNSDAAILVAYRLVEALQETFAHPDPHGGFDLLAEALVIQLVQEYARLGGVSLCLERPPQLERGMGGQTASVHRVYVAAQFLAGLERLLRPPKHHDGIRCVGSHRAESHHEYDAVR